MTRRVKEPTHTILVEEVLRSREDFFSLDMLVAAGAGSRSQVAAALWLLRQHRAADVVVNPDGQGWWFALPAEQDTRQRKQLERTPESRPRKPRGKKPTVVVEFD